MKVTIKKRLLKKGEFDKLYLEIYRGYHKDNDGKIIHNRKKESLNLEVYKNPKNEKEKKHNEDSWSTAEETRAKRHLSISKKQLGVYDETLLKSDFFVYAEKKTETTISSDNTIGVLNSSLKQFKKYTLKKTGKERLSFEDITSTYLEGFQHFLKNEATHKRKIKVKTNTAVAYWRKIVGMLEKAVKDEILQINPAKKVDAIKNVDVHKDLLTSEEIKLLKKTPMDIPLYKDVFIFSCYTGLRFIDMKNLKYSNIKEVSKGQYELQIIQEKTGKKVDIPLDKGALEIIGKPNKDNLFSYVFEDLAYSTYSLVLLQRWMMTAGILKKVTWHTARSSFGQILYNNTGDIYAVAELLGDTLETCIRNYVKNVDQKTKRKVINKLGF